MQARTIYETVGKGHGRIEKPYYLSSDLSGLEHAADWSGLSGIGMVRSQAAVGETLSSEIRYAITSLKSVERFAHAWRKHWGIENGLHCNSMLRPCPPFSFLSTILL